MVKQPLVLEDGYLIVPDAPGIGLELSDAVRQRVPYKPRQPQTRLHVDRSVVDQ